MKRVVTILTIVFVASGMASGYTYTIGPGEYIIPGTLNDHESMLINGGGAR